MVALHGIPADRDAGSRTRYNRDRSMSTIELGESRMSVQELAAKFAGELIPINSKFSYFCVLPIAEEDLKQYLHEPLAAISPAICAILPPTGILLAPFLQKVPNGGNGYYVTFEKPSEQQLVLASRVDLPDRTVLAFGVKEEQVADYHYTLYDALAAMVGERWSGEVQERFYRLIREELKSEVHGEINERSWHLKQALLRRQTNIRNETKLFRDYARQAFQDTLTLYMHGTCCDIDVETGPKQMPSRYLRKRLEELYAMFPPPPGYAVFPEHLRER